MRSCSCHLAPTVVAIVVGFCASCDATRVRIVKDFNQAYDPPIDAELDNLPFRTLCLSGGGYRAALYHAGGLIALSDADELKNVAVVSASSGGTLTAAMLGLNYKAIRQGEYSYKSVDLEVVAPVQELSKFSIDTTAVLAGLISPSKGSTDFVSSRLDSMLFNGATMRSFGRPVFDRDEKVVYMPIVFFNTTEMRSGTTFSFSNWYTGGEDLGWYPLSDTKLSDIIAASSAFPPVMSPLRLTLKRPPDFRRRPGEHSMEETRERAVSEGDYEFANALRYNLILADGGVIDNAALDRCLLKVKGSRGVISRAMTFYDVPVRYRSWLPLAKDTANLLHMTSEERQYQAFAKNRDFDHAVYALRTDGSRSDSLAIDAAEAKDYIETNPITSSLSSVTPLVTWLYIRYHRIESEGSDDAITNFSDWYPTLMCLANVDTRYGKLDEVESNALINLGYLNMHAALEMRGIIELATEQTNAGGIKVSLGTKMRGWNGMIPRPLPTKVPERCRPDKLTNYEVVLATSDEHARYLMRLAGIMEDPLLNLRSESLDGHTIE